MGLESKDLENIFSLVNQFKNMSSDKFIRLTYETDCNVIVIEVVNILSFEILKEIRYTITSQEDIEELENILEMYINLEEK